MDQQHPSETDSPSQGHHGNSRPLPSPECQPLVVVVRDRSEQRSHQGSNSEDSGIRNVQYPPQQSYSTNSVTYSAQMPPPHTTGSHNFDHGLFRDCQHVSFGNDGGQASHTYRDQTVRDSRTLFIGNTGTGSQGHHIINLDVQRVQAVRLGDFGSRTEKVLWEERHQSAPNQPTSDRETPEHE